MNKKTMLFSIFFVLFFSLSIQKGFSIFTIESSQKALITLLLVQKKMYQVLEYLKESFFGYQNLMLSQKKMIQALENHFEKNLITLHIIIEKIKTLEKENDSYENLINELLKSLYEFDAGITMYSEYMQNLDTSISLLLQKQKEGVFIIDQFQKLCNNLHN